MRGLSEPARRALLVLGSRGYPPVGSAAGDRRRTLRSGTPPTWSVALRRCPSRIRRARPAGPATSLLAAAVTESADPVSPAWAHAQVGAPCSSSTGTPHRRSRQRVTGPPPTAIRKSSRHPRRCSRRRIAWPTSPSPQGSGPGPTLVQTFPDRAADRGLLGVGRCGRRRAGPGPGPGTSRKALALAQDAFARLTPVEETLLGGTLRMWVGRFRSISDRAAGLRSSNDAVRVLSMS